MNLEEMLQRARSQMGLGIRYRMGGGTVRASRHTCADAQGSSDCSSFVCWALGLDKQGDYPWLVPPGRPRDPGGEWYGTDNMVNDAVHIPVGFFSVIQEPIRGCIVTYPTTWKNGKAKPAGHCGIVTSVSAGRIQKVIHCSHGAWKRQGDAIQETPPDVFDARSTSILAWCGRIDRETLSSSAASLELGMPVRFCVIAKGADRKAILDVARPLAAFNPIGRIVLVSGDPGFPSAADLATWTAGFASPGAVVLRPDGSISEVLDVAKSQHGFHVEKAFQRAAS